MRSSPDGRWLAVQVSDGLSTRRDLWLAELGDAEPHQPKLIPLRVGADARTDVVAFPGEAATGDRILLRTDDGAPRGRLEFADPRDPSAPAHILVEQSDEDTITDVVVNRSPEGQPMLLVVTQRHAVSRLQLHEAASGRPVAEVELPGLGWVGTLTVDPIQPEDVWFSYCDHGTRQVVLRLDTATRQVLPWPSTAGEALQPTVSVRHVSFPSRDGVPVWMFVIASDSVPDRPRPTILTAYGGFGVSMIPIFSPEMSVWVDTGGVFAVVCARGGGEEGVDWHRAAMKGGKQKTFDDVDAAAAWLYPTAGPARTSSALSDRPTAGLPWAQRSPSIQNATAQRYRWPRCWTWSGSSSSVGAGSGERSTAARPFRRSSERFSRTPPTTTSGPGRHTRPSCSGHSMATPG